MMLSMREDLKIKKLSDVSFSSFFVETHSRLGSPILVPAFLYQDPLFTMS